MGYEATAKSGTIVPLRSKDCDATTSANGYFRTGTTDNSSTDGTISMSNLTGVTTSDYEVYITGIKVTENNQQVYKYINIQRNNSSGNFYGATSGGTTSNKGRLYTSGNSNETNLLPEWSSETNNQFKFTANVSGQYKYLKYNTGSPRFAFYNSAGEKIVFYKKVVKHTLTYSATNGSIGGVVYGTSTTVNSGASVAEGGKVTLTAQPADGYVFSSWEVSGTGSSLSSTSTNPTTFTMGTADATITANFVVGIAYTITAQSNNNDYGTVALNGNVITANPAAGYTYANPAYTLTLGTATVEQNGNDFTVTPESNCTVTINFAAIPTHTATFSVNGNTTSNTFYEGQTITFPSNPAAINHKSFVGWYTAEYTNASVAPSYVNTTEETMGNNDVTYYAVFANVTTTYSETETETSQTLQYDTWTYNGTTTNMSSNNYRLFAEGAYIESASFDLSILKEVDVYAGTYGNLANDKKKVTVVAGQTTWGTATLSTNSQTTKNEITSSVSLSGNGQLHIVAGGGDGSDNGIRISKVDIITKKATTTISNYCTTIEVFTITAVSNNDEYGTVSLEGEVITGSPQPGYRYASPAYTVTVGTATVSQNGNEFTVTPTSDCTVRINFEAIPTYKATFYVNGTKDSEATVAEGADIDFPEVADISVMKFVGWTTSAIDGTQTSAPATLLSKATMGDSDVTYYAVFTEELSAYFAAADITNTPLTGTLTWTHTTSGISILLSAGQRYTNGTPNTFSVTKGTSNYLQVSSVANYNLTEVVVTVSEATYKINTVSSGASLSTSSTTQTITFSSNMTSVKCYATKDNQIRATTISVKARGPYCTTVYCFTSAGNWSESAKWAPSGAPASTNFVYINAACTIPNEVIASAQKIILGNSGSITIADGGQLICSNSVAATVKKSIANANANPKDHWYTISAPVHTGSNNYVTIGASTTVNLTNNGAYDMFAYDEPTHNWLNQKSGSGATGFDKMYAGQGYMYRSIEKDLSYVGNTTVGPVYIALSYTSTLDVAGLKGFNLIGNPYTHSIAKGSGKAIDNSKLSTGCYALTNSGTWTLITDGAEIKPNQGVLVEVSEAVADFQIKDINYVAPTPDPGKYKNDNIKFIVESSEYSDAAYAWFDKGIGLTKINHRNENAPMLYIPQDDNNYAIATMSDDVKVFGLNFKAATMGQYTLSYKATGDYNYLHVIDRITGADVDMLLEGEYTFVATHNDKENRFIVRLDYMPNYGEGNNEIFAFQSGSEILVSGQGELQIFDVTGRSVMTTTINGAESINLSAQGVYILRLVGNEVKTQKIVVR